MKKGRYRSVHPFEKLLMAKQITPGWFTNHPGRIGLSDVCLTIVFVTLTEF